MTSPPSFGDSAPPPLPDRPELPAGIDRPPLETHGRIPEGSPERDDLPRWPPWAPFAAMLLTLVIAIAGATVITVAAQLAGVDVSANHTPSGIQIGGTVVQDIGLIVSAVVFARLTDGTPTAWQFGLRRVRFGPATGWLVAVWVIFIVASSIYGALVDAPSVSNQAEELGAGQSTLNTVAVTALVTVVAPLSEEFFFRGFCFTTLWRWVGWLPGAVLAGAVFAAIHVGSVSAVFLPPLVLLGFLLCVLLKQTGSLLPCFALHALNNSLAMGQSQHWSAAGTVALMLGATTTVVSLGYLAARSGRLNPVPATA
jgi:membrane protease YdiL (CAAX protease family)